MLLIRCRISPPLFHLRPSQEGTSGKTALHFAVELRDITSVKLLLGRGANVDTAMFNGCTPLHLAVGRRDASIANILCQSGADTMLRNMEDETALDLADGNDDVSEGEGYTSRLLPRVKYSALLRGTWGRLFLEFIARWIECLP